MNSYDTIDLRLHDRNSDHCVNLNVKSDRTLRDVTDFLKQSISVNNEDYVYFQGI